MEGRGPACMPLTSFPKIPLHFPAVFGIVFSLPGLWSAFSAGDEQALSAYLTSQGRLRSFLTLWFLAVVQVLSLVIPAMPVQLAAGLAYGPWLGFVTSFSASAVANLTVFLAARRLAPVIRRLTADNAKATKLLNSVRSSKDPWFYTILAFITPGLPNGIIPYAAANAGMRPKHFIAAIFISLPFPTLLTCAAGSFILEGNWLFTVLVGVVLFSFVGVLFFNRTRLIAHAHDLKSRRIKRSKGLARKRNRIPLRYRFCKITASPLNKDFTLNLLYCNSPLKHQRPRHKASAFSVCQKRGRGGALAVCHVRNFPEKALLHQVGGRSRAPPLRIRNKDDILIRGVR